MANAIDVLDDLVREELPRVIHESLPEIAPTYNYIKTSSIGVVRDTGIGRDWQVEHMFDTGLAGLIQPAPPAGVGMVTNTNFKQSNFISQTAGIGLTPFPNALFAPHVSTIKRVLSLHKSTGNFSVPITWKQGDALSASQIGQVARDVAAVGKMRALTEASSFFMASNNTLCASAAATCYGYTTWANYVAGTTATFGTSAAITVLKITPEAGTGNIQFFREGMMVDLVSDSSGPVFGVGGTGLINDTSTGSPWGSTYIPLVISSVDRINGFFTVSAVGSGTLDSDQVTTNLGTTKFWVVLAGGSNAYSGSSGREMRTWGLEDWIAESGTIMQREGISGEGLPLDDYPQFRSVLATVSAPLTEDILNRYVGGFLNAYPGATIDTLITTMGVTMKFLQQPSLNNNRQLFDRTGKRLSYAAGWDEVTYSFNGRSLRWIIAPMCIAGRMYGVKFDGGNINRYVPPMVGGQDGQVADVEFLSPLGGSSNIFMVARTSASGGGYVSPTEILEAPFWQYCLIAPIDVKGVKLSSLTEATFTVA